jgi:hypothetical protein
MLLIAAVLVVGGAGLFAVLQSKPAATVQPTRLKEKLPAPAVLLALDTSKLPAGWTADRPDQGPIILTNQKTDCFVNALYSSDTAELQAPTIDHYKSRLDTIKSKGYSATDTPSTLTVTTPGGHKLLDAHLYKLTGQASPSVQKYAVVSTDKAYTQIQVSCPKEDQLADAETALAAITFTKL